MKVAALDIGTNTFLCLIAEGDHTKGITKIHSDLSEVVRLGQDVNKTKRLHSEALVRAENCLKKFSTEIEKHKVDQVLAMATSAARDVENSDELFKIFNKYNIPLKIIPGESEAQVTYQGATSDGCDQGAYTLVIDIGGGSTEIILGKDQKLFFHKSLNIGGVRMTEKFISSQPIVEEENKKLVSFLKSEIENKITPELKKYKVDQVISVAGTPAALAILEIGKYSQEQVDKFEITQTTLNKWIKIFSETSVEEKKQKFNLGGRADIIFAGSQILLQILTQLNLSSTRVSTRGVRHGVALEMFKN